MNKKQSVCVRGVEFTVQELAVVGMLKKGRCYKDISEKLGVSVKAIDYHIKNIKEKTGSESKEDILKFFNNRKKGIKEIIKGKLSVNDLKFLKALVGILFILLIFAIVFYPTEKKSSEITNVSNFTDNFLDRPYLENKIIQMLKWQKGIKSVVIYGTGGGGKTTVARRVLSLLNREVKFEINAETERTLYNSYMELADNIVTTNEQRKEIEIIRSLGDADYRKKRLIRLISSVLKSKSSWVLLFDNVGAFEAVQGYFPTNEEIWGNGTVLITSRNQNLGESNYIKREHMIDVGTLEDLEKKELFSNIVYNCCFARLSSMDQRRVSDFLSIVPEFPLDVCAVAYYIRNTNIILEEYSDLLRKRIKKLNKEQRSLMRENSGYNETRYGIITSSLKVILDDKIENKLLLFFIALMDSQGIPKYLLSNATNSVDTGSFIKRLREHSLVTDNGSEISIHRSNHRIAYDYILKNVSPEELDRFIEIISDVIFDKSELKLTFVPHLESILSKISEMSASMNTPSIKRAQSKLLLLMAEILRVKSHKMMEAINCLNKVLAINSKEQYLDERLLARVKSRLGELYTIINQNSLAGKYLEEGLQVFSDNDVEKVRGSTMLGIVRMRQGRFIDSNKCFLEALDCLKPLEISEIRKGLLEANIYEFMATNYFMDGINRKNARVAVEFMNKAIDVLKDEKFDADEECVTRRSVHRIKLAGIYNALGQYQQALDLADKTEDMLNKAGYENADTLYVRGIIARERGVANLRLNRVSKAYSCFLKSKEDFLKLAKGDYLFKIKLHETECLIRLGRLDEAMDLCEDMINETDRERNNYSDLFYNTEMYHAAIIEFRRKNFESSRRYFRLFFKNMKELCQKILPEHSYKELIKLRVFGGESNDFAEYFKNSLEVFESIYWKNYEFTRSYVEKNISLLDREQ